MTEHQSEAERIASMLQRLYEWLQDFLETDPSDAARARMRDRVLAYVEDIGVIDVDSDEPQKLLEKLKGGFRPLVGVRDRQGCRPDEN